MPQQPNTDDVKSFVQRYLPLEDRPAAIAVADDAASTAPTSAANVDPADLILTQTVFGWGTEDVEVQIDAMAKDAVEVRLVLVVSIHIFSNLFMYSSSSFVRISTDCLPIPTHAHTTHPHTPLPTHPNTLTNPT